MPRDIRIYPKLGSTSSNDFPRIEFNGLSASSISLKVDDDGSVLYTGTYGTLFNISDSKDGLLHSVNDISGLPILQVYSYDYVQMGKWDKYSLVVNSDKVGVGLTAPSAFLHVSPTGSSTVPLILASGSSTTDLVRITQVGSGNAFVVEDSTNPDTSPFVIDTNGNVGIGTASPSTKVHIFSTQSGAFRLQDTSQANRYILVSDANGVGTWGSVSSLSIVTASGTLNYVPRYTGSNTLSATGSIYDTGSLVGIGITNSAAVLHVSNASTTVPLIIASGSSTNDLVRITQVGTGNALVVEDSSNPDATPFVVTGDGRVGVGITGPSASLHILGGTATTVFKVDGTSGELFSITDSLQGSLFSVNDISGLPILEVFSDNTTLIGDYYSPALITTKKTTLVSGTNSIYAFATFSYTGAFIDYTATSGQNARSGNLSAIWLGSSIQFNETSTLDIGTTSGLTLSFAISGTYAVFQAAASTTWELKTIIRSI